jgi:integrase
MPARLPDCITRRKKPDGTLGFRVQIRRRGVPDYSFTFDTLKEALANRDDYLGRVRKLQAGGCNDGVTVQHAIDGYQKSDRFRSLAHPATVASVQRYWAKRLGTTLLAELPGTRCAVERDKLTRVKKTGATVCAYLSGLSVAWDWAHENLGAVTNQLLTIKWPKIKRGPPAKFTAAQVRYVLKKADGYEPWPPLGLLARLTMITTQRKGTCMSPRWREIDLVEGTIEVERVKNGRAMSLPVEGETLELLRAHHKRELTAARGRPQDYVFQSPKLYQPMEAKKHIDWLFDKKDKELGGLTFKHLRSTALSRLFTHAKLDVPRVMAISGHRTARVLLEHYAHANLDETRRAIRDAADMLLGK